MLLLERGHSSSGGLVEDDHVFPRDHVHARSDGRVTKRSFSVHAGRKQPSLVRTGKREGRCDVDSPVAADVPATTANTAVAVAVAADISTANATAAANAAAATDVPAAAADAAITNTAAADVPAVAYIVSCRLGNYLTGLQNNEERQPGCTRVASRQHRHGLLSMVMTERGIQDVLAEQRSIPPHDLPYCFAA